MHVTNTNATEYMERLGRRGMVLGLDTMRKLLSRLGNPQNQLRFVHVAGTNGKGSVIAYLSEMLMRSGYKTGAYTSPAVFEPLEIYRINDKNITQECYERLLGEVREAADWLEAQQNVLPTRFEVETALALQWFSKEQCDLVLLECGLGGALDATNCIEAPLCAVLTSIGEDHTQILGHTLEEIARQKAGIIKRGTAVVSSPQNEQVTRLLQKVCEEKEVPFLQVQEQDLAWELHVTDDSGSAETNRSVLQYKDFPKVKPAMAGRHQLINAATALETVRLLGSRGFAVCDEAVCQGIAHASLPGRLTAASTKPLILMDGAHNPPAASRLAETISSEYGDRQWCVIMGVFADKAYEELLKLLAPKIEQMFCITPDSPRALPAGRLADAARAQGISAQPAHSLKAALERALRWCGNEPQRSILACGSLSFLGAFQETVEMLMIRVNRLIQHPLFSQAMEQMEMLEADRPFCRHGWAHCMDVARVLALLNEERKTGFDRELLYALALVHDLGRVEQYENQIPHEEAGASLAGQLLADSGFSREETSMAVRAVLGHRSRAAGGDVLTAMLMEADHSTRLCFQCRAREQCYWEEEKKNLRIKR